MNCLGWNCRGLGNPRTVRVLGDLVRDRKPDVLFLSETISTSNIIESLRLKFGFAQCFLVDRVGQSGGLAVFWKANVSCQITEYSQNHIDIQFLENSVVTWRLSCFYGYPERSRRKNSWDLIRQLADISQLPWLIFGDFNDLLDKSDKWGRAVHPQSLMDGFRLALEDSFLSELDLCGGKFTWERCRGKPGWVRERLDRAFGTVSWLNKFPLCKLTVHHTSRSDHDPIQVELVSTSISRRLFRFKFENVWLKDPNFVKEVKEFWSKIPVMHLLPKLLDATSFYG
ncbi:uncharacterized protein LOC141715026 [Apium graveolens]|uniref:uncharacterized protein LOC141715026 n=1 Tax=Apium graveolens TaxID=4045 RepID=UPI003D7B499E